METTHLISPPPNTADSVGSELDEIIPLVDVVAVAGPPVIFVAGPWLLFGLMLAAPFAVALTLVLALAAATVVVAALAALLVSPYLLARHLRERPARPSPMASAAPAVTLSTARLWPVAA